MAVVSTTILNLKYGEFKVLYHKNEAGDCVSFSYGDVDSATPIVRIHSACLFGEAFFSMHCDCGQQLDQSLQKIKEHGCGVIVYSYDEGRGIGLENKIKSMGMERAKGINTVEAFKELGYDTHDYRVYNKEISALQDIDLHQTIWLVSNNPEKISALENAGYSIEKLVKLEIEINEYNKGEIMVKKNHLNYYID